MSATNNTSIEKAKEMNLKPFMYSGMPCPKPIKSIAATIMDKHKRGEFTRLMMVAESDAARKRKSTKTVDKD